MDKKNNKKHMLKIMIFVFSIIILGFSGTYAYFTTAFIGEPSKTQITSGVFKITSSLENVSAINNKNILFINENQRSTHAEKLTFTITSTSESNVDGTFDLYLKDINLSKNLYSSYLKWELLKGTEIIEQGDFSTANREDTPNDGEKNNVMTRVSDIKITKNPIPIKKNTTETLVFRMYLLNDENVNQIALTEGSFNGRLYLEAIPVSSLNS